MQAGARRLASTPLTRGKPPVADVEWVGGRTPRVRNVVTRADGKLVNVGRQMGQLFVCAYGCCCGRPEGGHPEGHDELFHNEWERRKLRNRVHLNMGGCLGPCPLANVVMLLFEGRSTFFHSINTEREVLALYDYIDRQVAAERYLPPPPELAPLAFSAFRWDSEAHAPDAGTVVLTPIAVEPRGFVILTHADTDVLALSRIATTLGDDFPPVRAYNIGHLQSEADAAAFIEAVVPEAEVVLLKLHGGKASFPGFEYLVRGVEQRGQWLVALPGTDDLDPDLTAVSNAGVPIAHEAKAYLQLGGLENFRQMLRFLSDHLLTTGFGYERPAEQPRHGVYHPALGATTLEAWRARAVPGQPTVGVLFYRAFLLTGNTSAIDALIEAGEAAGLNMLAVYLYSLKEPAAIGEAFPPAIAYFADTEGRATVDVVVNTTSFAMGSSSSDDRAEEEWASDLLRMLDVPQLQAMNASTSVERWEASEAGLSPLDVAMNVAIPELDGRIITVPLSFKEALPLSEDGVALGDVVQSAPRADRVARIVGIASRFARLRHLPNAEKRIAIVLTNHNAKASRIANAVGLDSPASLLRLLEEMRDAGYEVGPLPADGDALLLELIDRGSYDREVLTEAQLSSPAARVPVATYRAWEAELPERRRREMEAQWGAAPGRYYVAQDGSLALAGLRFGNVFVAVQPPRGYGMDATAAMHRPDLAPPYPYHALYRWLAEPQTSGGFGTDAVVHMGKHGSLEWLPGKGVGVAADCYPDLFLGDLPLIYPFIVDDPGEGAAAKRRTHATIVDHLPPPMTTAGIYGELEQLARLVDEYYLLERTDPAKLPLLQQQIWALIREANLDSELDALLRTDTSHTHEWDATTHEDGVPYSLSDLTGSDFRHLVEAIHSYTHELSGAPIRDGLHILGQAPEGVPLVDTLALLLRLPNGDVPSLREAVAAVFALDLRALSEAPGASFAAPDALVARAGNPLVAAAAAIEAVDAIAHALLTMLEADAFATGAIEDAVARHLGAVGDLGGVREALTYACGRLVPALRRTPEELTHIIDALDGRYVPPGPSGAPTRGMAHVLPTGRNFYTVDPRSLPSPTAWLVGQQLADGVVERHQRDEGRAPQRIGISIWGTSAMRTSGDDIAQVLALLGVRPRWQPESRRVLGIEVIPIAELGRPRVDVVCRISGFFRDAFPHAVAMIDEAVDLVSGLDEPPEQNPVRHLRMQERDALVSRGIEAREAWARAGYRVFGSPPGTYGAGILQLMDDGQWSGDADVAETYLNWGGYAYTRAVYGVDAREDFREALMGVEVAVKNQDNREHDIYDSDDYFQFHGGMIATIRSLTGRQPRRYFGDSQDPRRPKVRDLQEESHRVFRSRVVNPRWLESIQRHGYKGALELAATVDYLFGYDATAGVVEDWMYAQVAARYALDPAMQAFFRRSNPWALKDIASRLIEAADRGLWAEPGDLRGALEALYLDTETDIEARAELPLLPKATS